MNSLLKLVTEAHGGVDRWYSEITEGGFVGHGWDLVCQGKT